jgi:hypothetical protein
VVEGGARCGDLALTEGDTMLVPASAGAASVEAGPGFVGLRYGPNAAG